MSDTFLQNPQFGHNSERNKTILAIFHVELPPFKDVSVFGLT